MPLIPLGFRLDSAWIPLGFHWLGGVRSDRLLLNFREWLESRFDSLEAKWDAKCWLAEEILKCQICQSLSITVILWRNSLNYWRVMKSPLKDFKTFGHLWNTIERHCQHNLTLNRVDNLVKILVCSGSVLRRIGHLTLLSNFSHRLLRHEANLRLTKCLWNSNCFLKGQGEPGRARWLQYSPAV